MSYGGYGGKDYGYSEAGYGYGVRAFTGFDGLAAVPDLLGWWSVSRRVLARYSGPAIRLRRSSDSTEQDFYGIGPQGEVSTAAVRAFNGWNVSPNSSAVDRWTGRGTSPPTVALNQTHLGEPCASVTFLAGTASGFETSRADRNESGIRFFVRNGVSYVMTIDVTISRPLVSTETLSVFHTGAFGGSAFILNSTNTSSLVGTWTRITVPVAAVTVTGTNYPVVFCSGAIGASDVTLYVKNVQVEVGTTPTTYEPRTTTAAGDSFLVTLYDQSGLARNFTQSTTTLQPIICEQGVPVTENGRLAAKFVAADARRMSIASSTAMFNALHTTGGSVLAVAKANDTATTKRFLSNRNATSGAGFTVASSASEVLSASTSRLDVAGVATTGLSVSLASSGSIATSQSVIAIALDPDNATAASRGTLWVNGTSVSAANAEAGTPFVENAQGNLTLGADPAGTNPLDGTFSEASPFSSVISDADRTAYQSRSGIFFTVTIA